MKKLLTLAVMFAMAAAVTHAQVTFTALAGQNWGGNEQIDKLFDGTSNKWCTSASGAWFTFEASEAIILTGYAMRTGSDDGDDNLNRNPKSWTIYGSNDDSNHGKDGAWTPIKQVTNNSDMDGNKQKTFYFSIDNNYTPYKYYKVTIEAVRSGSNVQISEFIPSYLLKARGIEGGDWWHNSDPWENMFDGDLATRWCCGVNDSRNYLVFDVMHPMVLQSYMLATGNDTQSYSDRNPTGWTIWGTNTDNPTHDGDYWNEVVVETDNTTLQALNSTPYTFNVSGSPSAYRYYMFKVTSAPSNGMFQLDEIALIGSHDHSSSSTYSFTGGNTTQQVELCDVCNKAMTSGYKGFTLVDGKPFSVFVNGWGGNGSFTYSRTVSSPMGTICLPYTLNAGSKTDATYYTLAFYNSVSDALVFDQVTGVLNQRTPAIYVLTDENGSSINLDNHGSAAFGVTPSGSVVEVNDRAADGWAMVGTIKDGTASESGNSIYYLKGGNFYRCNGSINFKPYRAYIIGPAGGGSVKAFDLADDMEDAINDIMPAENGEIQLYDLSGRKVNNIRNGEVYIMNGRKVMFNK